MLTLLFSVCREFKKYDNPVDLGIKPANRLQSPKIALADVEKNVNKSTSKFHGCSVDTGCLGTMRSEISALSAEL